MNAYEQPEQPMFNRYDFLSSFEEQEAESPNESEETGDQQGETEPRITRADIQTTGEKIPYFRHMRKTQ